ncbi:hypothetical protein PSPO01_01410 [Paraphaeosphaeria sporulosa]
MICNILVTPLPQCLEPKYSIHTLAGTPDSQHELDEEDASEAESGKRSNEEHRERQALVKRDLLELDEDEFVGRSGADTIVLALALTQLPSLREVFILPTEPDYKIYDRRSHGEYTHSFEEVSKPAKYEGLAEVWTFGGVVCAPKCNANTLFVVKESKDLPEDHLIKDSSSSHTVDAAKRSSLSRQRARKGPDSSSATRTRNPKSLGSCQRPLNNPSTCTARETTDPTQPTLARPRPPLLRQTDWRTITLSLQLRFLLLFDSEQPT